MLRAGFFFTGRFGISISLFNDFKPSIKQIKFQELDEGREVGKEHVREMVVQG